MRKTGAVISLGLTLAAAGPVMAGCERGTSPESRPTAAASPSPVVSQACGELAAYKLIGNTSSGNAQAENTGACVSVHDELRRDIGFIAANGGKFEIICETGPSPIGFRIRFGDGQPGEVIASSAAGDMNGYRLPDDCPPGLPTPQTP